MQYELRVAGHGVSDVGRVRSKNEDSLLLLDRQQIYCVADGMGGVSGGDIASRKVVECIKSQTGRLDPSLPLKDRILAVHQAVLQANDWILGWSEQNAVQGAGTTLVLLALSEEYPWAVNILHAGDSRAYRYRSGRLEQVTADHSLEEAVGDNSGQPLPSQFRGLITNAVGLKKSLSMELTHADQETGDLWLLCSDGLTKMLPDDAIASMLAENAEAGADVLAQRLVDAANAAGGKDNVSVVIVKVLECSRCPAGGDAVPFPGPLPAPPEDDSASGDTTMTAAMSMDSDTNGSVMMSLETSNGETDFLSHEGAGGIPKTLRWLLIALCSMIIIYVIWTLTLGREKPAPAPKPAAVQTASPQPAPPAAVSLSDLTAAAQRSGDWRHAHTLMQESGAGQVAEPSRNAKTISGWYSEWAEAEQHPQQAVRMMPEFVEAASDAALSVDGNALSVYGSWPEEPAGIAAEYCRRRYRLQQLLARELNGFWVSSSRRISFMQSLPAAHVEAAFLAAGSDEQEYHRALSEAEAAAQELEHWLKDRIFLPITIEQLEALPDALIKDCGKAVTAVAQLTAVLEAEPESAQVQRSWKSVQKVLENLESGELSAGDERSIRRYLEELYTAEQPTGQE